MYEKRWIIYWESRLNLKRRSCRQVPASSSKANGKKGSKQGEMRGRRTSRFNHLIYQITIKEKIMYRAASFFGSRTLLSNTTSDRIRSYII